jgi:hypothetical protein
VDDLEPKVEDEFAATNSTGAANGNGHGNGNGNGNGTDAGQPDPVGSGRSTGRDQ